MFITLIIYKYLSTIQQIVEHWRVLKEKIFLCYSQSFLNFPQRHTNFCWLNLRNVCPKIVEY